MRVHIFVPLPFLAGLFLVHPYPLPITASAAFRQLHAFKRHFPRLIFRVKVRLLPLKRLKKAQVKGAKKKYLRQMLVLHRLPEPIVIARLMALFPALLLVLLHFLFRTPLIYRAGEFRPLKR